MGNFASTVSKGVKWLGSCVCQVVGWFFQVLEYVSGIVKDFLFSIENIIKSADDPKTFGEAAGIKKELQCLEKELDKRMEKLSSSDKDKLDELFSHPDYD